MTDIIFEQDSHAIVLIVMITGKKASQSSTFEGDFKQNLRPGNIFSISCLSQTKSSGEPFSKFW